jgi:hypothetical protein
LLTIKEPGDEVVDVDLALSHDGGAACGVGDVGRVKFQTEKVCVTRTEDFVKFLLSAPPLELCISQLTDTEILHLALLR